MNSATRAAKPIFKQENAVFITKVLQLAFSSCSLGLDLSCHLVCRVNFRVICLTCALNMTTKSQPNLLAAKGAVCRRKAAGQSKTNLTSELCAALTPHFYLMKSFSNLLVFDIFDCMLTQRQDWSPPTEQLLSIRGTDHNSYRFQAKKKSSLVKQMLSFL